MRVAIGTIEFTDEDRRILADRIGQRKLATREQCREWVLGIAEATLDSMGY